MGVYASHRCTGIGDITYLNLECGSTDCNAAPHSFYE
jgi:hypothetical protein